jgi:hypothetical protein
MGFSIRCPSDIHYVRIFIDGLLQLSRQMIAEHEQIALVCSDDTTLEISI